MVVSYESKFVFVYFFPKVYCNKPEYDLFKLINTSIVSKAEKLESDFRVSESISYNPKLRKGILTICGYHVTMKNHVKTTSVRNRKLKVEGSCVQDGWMSWAPRP